MVIASTVSSQTQRRSKRVTLTVRNSRVVMDNGILHLTISKPQGHIIAIKYNRIDNLLDLSNGNDNLGGYWDVVWNSPRSRNIDVFERLDGTEFKIIVQTVNHVEVSFKRYWTGFHGNTVPLSTDIRFHYMVISDKKQKEMPAEIDRRAPRGMKLDYKEAVLIDDPIEANMKGQVDDKYQYTLDHKDNQVHGWTSGNPSTGFWIITPSYEFKTGGPLKQDLTSHTGPTSLAVFIGDHYIGNDIHFRLQYGEYWKKTLGPVFIYLNSNSNRNLLWQDAKAQMRKEVLSWPYSFPASKDFLKPYQRGLITGRLLIQDRYGSMRHKLADFPYVGLALPGQLGSWQKERKGYQFWTRADANGNFVIRNVIPGYYNLYAWAPGFVGDFMHHVTISITAGARINLGVLTFHPPRAGPTLWEIGVPDRSAAEFFIPYPNPKYMNRLYMNFEKYRQYGLWERYTDLYPKHDLIYRVGTSDYRKDWFFAQVTRRVGHNYYGTTWQIKFNLHNVQKRSFYTLRIAVATSHLSRLEVRVNYPKGRAQFITNQFGGGNAIARHGIHGLQWNFEVPIKGTLLFEGENTIYLTQSRGGSKFIGIMYDYIRLEGPSHA
ncbi:hypothetical protein LUZ61_013535 [Rhynchospora tenuis]|uniref:rhamnogalacturonan endolyase n=1 Tax=Rhynchospora tenuis TaxID=198213 RepID=A0AAD5W8W6_9POAL|nr:hypothetical protein LUZ61_013535 [Rhynchospora tenuis]